MSVCYSHDDPQPHSHPSDWVDFGPLHGGDHDDDIPQRLGSLASQQSSVNISGMRSAYGNGERDNGWRGGDDRDDEVGGHLPGGHPIHHAPEASVTLSLTQADDDAVKRMFRLVHGDEPSPDDQRMAHDVLQNGGSLADVAKHVLGDGGQHSPSDHAGNQHFAEGVIGGSNLSDPDHHIEKAVAGLNEGTLSKAEVLAAVAVHEAHEDHTSHIHLNHTY